MAKLEATLLLLVVAYVVQNPRQELHVGYLLDEFRPFFYQYACAREGLLSFVLLLILHGGEQRLQFEATNPIIAQPPEKRIATGHFRIEANVAK